MSGEIAAVAKTWLTEPRYIASFKLTSDVFKVYEPIFIKLDNDNPLFEDYLCNLITMMGSIVLAVNFLASMGTGPVNCMLKSTKQETMFILAFINPIFASRQVF